MLTIFNQKHMKWEDNGETSVCYYELFMDSASELPTDLYCFSNQSYKYKIGQGSLAYDITTSDMYMMKTDGTWIKQ